MRYEGPIYRPPSEADSLLVQATVGCPHNLCTFCMVYKQGVKFKVRPTREVIADLEEACRTYGSAVWTIFLPAGNTIAMPTAALAEICRQASLLFPRLERITVYGSAQYIYRKGLDNLKTLAAAGLKRIHVGLESGDDTILAQVKKGADSRTMIAAGRMVRQAGMELNSYVILGLGGRERSNIHARETARVINEMAPQVVRLRTLVPKINTPLLEDVQAGRLHLLGPHEAIRETMALIEAITQRIQMASDHYTNYVNVAGRLPEDKAEILSTLQKSLAREESSFRPFFIGTQ
ncbi:MAG: radical SAM protein [Deltaproteobacteria bacterium]|nr:radical SAM protein [Deltaproteobacteria bacterium]